jgi:lipid A disaccharide synthetase
MANHKPTVILYKITPLSFMLQQLLRRAKYITLVNLLAASRVEREQWATYDPDKVGAEAVPYPEYLTCRDRTPDIAAQVAAWLDDPSRREQTIRWLDELTAKYGAAGASRNAADYILATLNAIHSINTGASPPSTSDSSMRTRRAA